MPRGRRRALVGALAGIALAVTACGGGGTPHRADQVALARPHAVAADTVLDGGSATFALEKSITDFNPISGDGAAADFQYVLNGVFPAAFTQLPDFTVTRNGDLLTSARVTSTSPQTVVYTIAPSAIWSDGTPISADDFILNWQTQSGRDERYVAASSTGYEDIASVRGSDGGKTVTAVFSRPFGDWQSLFGTLLPARHLRSLGEPHAVFNEGPSALAAVSGGPFVLDSFQPGQQVALKRNSRYYGPRAHLDTVVFREITDANNEPQALANGEVQVINPQPQVDLVRNVVRIGKRVTYEMGLGPNFEHIDLNLATPALSKLPLRRALLTAVDRGQLLDATVKQISGGIGPLNDRMLVAGQTGYQDNVTPAALGTGDVVAARKILIDAGYRIENNALVDPAGRPVPRLKAVYAAGNPTRQQELELMAQQVAPLGVQLAISPTDDFGTSVAGKSDFDIVVFGWVGSPFPSSQNKSIYVTGGGQNFGQYSNPAVDRALDAATAELDPARSAALLNEADVQISRDAYTLPLYQKPTFLAHDSSLGNVRSNATAVGPTYNVGEWGRRS